MSERIRAKVRFVPKSKTLTEWKNENPILLAGEHGVATDGNKSNREKIGDGKTPWNDLDWWNGMSAYETAVENGFNGSETEWLESIKGEKGDKGDKGDPGELRNVDTVYNPKSENAQSGKAVNDAVKNKIDRLNLSKVETLDNFKNATKGLYISNSWGEGEARLVKLSYEEDPNTVVCRGGLGQIRVAMKEGDTIYKGPAVPSDYITQKFDNYLNNRLLSLERAYKEFQTQIDNSKVSSQYVSNTKFELDWNSMYLIASNTSDNFYIYDSSTEAVVLDGDGNALPSSKMCLFILPKENTRLDNNGKQGKLCLFINLNGIYTKALQFSITNGASLYLPTSTQASVFKIGI